MEMKNDISAQTIGDITGQRHIMLDMQHLAWVRHKYVTGLNRIRRSQPSSSDNCITNHATDNRTICSYFTSTLKYHTLSQK